MKKILLLLLLLFIVNLKTIKTEVTVINALAYSYTEKQQIYSPLIDGFNNYAKENNLDIELKLNILTPENSTADLASYAETISGILSKQSDLSKQNKQQKQIKSNDYDIFFYYGSYSSTFAPHFLNLKKNLTSVYLSQYSDSVIKSLTFDNGLIVFPLYIDISALYSNIELLGKYSKTIPKTWDELIDTAQYIMDREKNNNDLIAYNGLCNESNGVVSLYEFIHSARDSQADPHPDVKSQQTINALRKLKYLKDQISSDSIFQSQDAYTIEKINTGKALFLKFYSIDHPSFFKTTALPGIKEGVSGSVGLVNALGVSKYINQIRREASIKFIQYIASKEVQKEFVLRNKLISALQSIYNDTEVCSVIDCDLVHGAMPFTTMNYSNKEFGSNNYKNKYVQYFYDYLYNGKDLNKAIEHVENALITYSFSLGTSDTVAGLILFIIIVISLLTMGAFVFLFVIKKITEKSKYVFWVVSTLGAMIIILSTFTQYEDLTPTKCNLRLLFVSCGYCTCLAPALYIALENKSSFAVIEKFKYPFVCGLILIEIFFNLLSMLISSQEVEFYDVPYGKNFKKCTTNKTFGKVMYAFITLYMLIITAFIISLVFTEYSSSKSSTNYDLKTVIATIFSNIVFFVLFFIINRIKIDNYIAYNVLNAITAYLISLSDYSLIYGKKIIQTLISGDPDEKNEKSNSNSNEPTTVKSNDV